MNKKEEYQEIYINLDDSGKLTKKEKVSVYAGIVFLSKQEKDKFITQYRKIINEIKCSYCNEEKGKCTKKCKEIKNTNIKNSHKKPPQALSLTEVFVTYPLLPCSLQAACQYPRA